MTRKVWIRSMLSIAWLTAAAAHAQPDAFWCGTHLIRKGMAATDIVARCGEPDAKQIVEEPVFAWRPGGGRVEVGTKVIEYWTYDRGARSFPARITIEAGLAAEVTVLSRR